MTNHPRKFASNFEINKGSILLLFNEHDANIARNWLKDTKPDHEILGPDSLTA
jgi:hypothetical protein